MDAQEPGASMTTLDGDREKPKIELIDQTNLLPLKQILFSFLCLGFCCIVSALDSVIIATALSTISTAFNAGSIISWLPAGFLLTSTVFQPLYGRASDIFGRKAALSTSLIILAIGNLASGFSNSIAQLIVARAIAGIGAGGILGICQIIVSDIVTVRERGKYHGIILVFVTLGFGIGPIIGGLLAEKVTWRWCFWVTVPAASISVLFVYFLPLRAVKGGIKSKLLVIDYIGTGLSLVGFTLIILPLIWGGAKYPWSSPAILAPLFSGIFIIILFCLWEWKGAKLPIVPMYIFRLPTIVGVYITIFVTGFVASSVVYYIPLYLQVAFGYKPLQAGFSIIPAMTGQMVASWATGLIISRTGRYRPIIYSGLALSSVACGLITTITPSSHKTVIVVYILLSGIGSGQTLQTTTVAAQASVPRQDVSVVTVFRNFVRVLGGTLSQAVGASIINNTLRLTMLNLGLQPSLIAAVIDKPTHLSSPNLLGISPETASFIVTHGYSRGFKNIFFINAGLTALATITSIALIKHTDLPKRQDVEGRCVVGKISDLNSNSEVKIAA